MPCQGSRHHHLSTPAVGLALIAILLAAGSATGQTWYGPEDPPPLGVVQTFLNGSATDGDIGRGTGEIMTFEYVQLAS